MVGEGAHRQPLTLGRVSFLTATRPVTFALPVNPQGATFPSAMSARN
jgi:hypothetical protein